MGGDVLGEGEVVADRTAVAAQGNAMMMVFEQGGWRKIDGGRGAFAARGDKLADGFVGADGEEAVEMGHGSGGWVRRGLLFVAGQGAFVGGAEAAAVAGFAQGVEERGGEQERQPEHGDEEDAESVFQRAGQAGSSVQA